MTMPSDSPVPQQPQPSDVEYSISSDAKLWAALSYALSPIVPVIIMLMDDKKNDPFIKPHNNQALIWGLISIGTAVLLGWTIVLSCVPLFIYIFQLFLAFKAYKGETFDMFYRKK